MKKLIINSIPQGDWSLTVKGISVIKTGNIQWTDLRIEEASNDSK